MVPVGEMDQAHDAPEVVDPVGVIKRHAPAVRLRRETAQEQDICVLRQEGLKRVCFYHHPAKIQNVEKGTVPISTFRIVFYICVLFAKSVILCHEKQGIIVNLVFTM